MGVEIGFVSFYTVVPWPKRNPPHDFEGVDLAALGIRHVGLHGYVVPDGFATWLTCSAL